jgi:two-component system, NarL family, nitrate/nitrite response regulator NarL
MNIRGRTLSVLIADDHPLVLQGLVEILGSYLDIKVVAKCPDGYSAMKAIQAFSPDVAVLDMAMPGLSGLDVLSAMTASQKTTRFVLLTASASDKQVVTALARGATGILHKDGAFEDIVHCVREAAEGRRWLSSTISAMIERHGRSAQSPKNAKGRLTAREQELVLLVARGLSNKEIARELRLSEGTVKIHLHKTFQKLGVTNRTALAAVAVNNPFTFVTSTDPGSERKAAAQEILPRR